MKPEKGSGEMEEPACDPREMFAEVGLMIMEARLPDVSRKGRVEGPHYPTVKGEKGHVCDRHKEQCRKASDLLSQQQVLWKNRIPMRVDILLFPNCEHGMREATVVEGATFSSAENFMLLERWDIQVTRKRNPEKTDELVTGRFLMQAIRSYLHFSQLSSWLISTGGALPLQIVHRVYAPGEVANYDFISPPEIHNFPPADLGEVVMRSIVTHLPRQDSIISLLCNLVSPDVEYCRVRKSPISDQQRLRKSPPFEYKAECLNQPGTSKDNIEDDRHTMILGKNSHVKDHSNHGKRKATATSQQIIQKPPVGKKSFESTTSSESIAVDEECQKTYPITQSNKRKVDQLSPSMTELDNYRLRSPDDLDLRPQLQPVSKEQGTSALKLSKSTTSTSSVKTKSVVPPSSLTFSKLEMPEVKHARFPGQISPQKTSSSSRKSGSKLSVAMAATNPTVLTKRLPSPKVLFTESRKPEPSVYKKRCIDLGTPSSEESDSGLNFKELDEFTTDEFQDLVKPLSPSQLEAYLSSLSNKTPKKLKVSKLCDIPSTNCKFYIGEMSEQTDSQLPESSKLTTDTHELSPPSHSPTSLSQTTPSPPKGDRLPVRALFRKSFSTSEVEGDLSRESYDTHKCSVSRTEQQRRVPVSGNDVFAESQTSRDSTLNQCDTQRNDFQINLQMQKSIPKGEVTLDDISIPCKVGTVTNALTSLIQDLELMEIDDKSKTSSPNGSSPNLLDLGADVSSSPKTLSDAVFANGSSTESMKISENGTPIAKSPPIMENGATSSKLSLCKQLLQKEFHHKAQSETFDFPCRSKNLPSPDDIHNFHCHIGRSASALFNSTTGLPSRSSPAPIKKKSSNRFDYDCTLTNVRAIKNALSCSKLTLQSENKNEEIEDPKIISTSAPASTQCLLGNFEESVLNGRIEPVGVVDGFTVEIGAGGMFCPKHVTLPVAAYFFQLSDDNAPSPYLGHISLEPLGKRGYHIPRSGTVQVTLFNPNKTVVKMFVVMYDLSDMPANCQTFLRQRTMYMPVNDNSQEPTYLRYLIHLRFASSKSGKIYLHTDIRLIFARDKFEYDPRVANYELRSFTEGPENPKFSPKR